MGEYLGFQNDSKTITETITQLHKKVLGKTMSHVRELVVSAPATEKAYAMSLKRSARKELDSSSTAIVGKKNPPKAMHILT